MPAIQDFLQQQGLNFSAQKTRITRIEDGFGFPEQNLRKHGDKLVISPSKSSVKAIVAKTRKIIKANLDDFVKNIQRAYSVIPANAGIQCFQRLQEIPGPRLSPG